MLRFFDGFDHYAQADIALKWSSVAGTTSNPASSATRYTGGLGFILASGSLKKVIDAQGTWTLGVALHLNRIDILNAFFQLLSAGTVIAEARIEANSKASIVTFNSDGTTSTLGTGSTLYMAGIWYFMEWKFKGASVAGNIVTSLKVNGVTDINFTGSQSGTFPATTRSSTADTVALNAGTLCTNNFDDFYAVDDGNKTGTINHAGGYSAGVTTILVSGVTGIVAIGNTFTLATETGTPTHFVTSHIETSGNTTSVTFIPALASSISNSAALVFTSKDNGFLGDVRVDTLSPNAAGSSTQWTPLTGNNWAEVAETQQDGDTSYVSTNTATNRDMYALVDLFSTPTTIYGIQTSVFARRDDVATHLLDLSVRVSSTNYQTSDFTMTSSYAWYAKLWDRSPATSIAWTSTEVNALESGVVLIS